MSSRKPIDLSTLKAPKLFAVPAIETIYQSMIDELKKQLPDFSSPLDSDPAAKILQAASFCAHKMLHEINHAGHQVMLAFARGSNLDHLGALLGVLRSIDKNHQPENDEHFRARIQQAPHSFNNAGSREAYQFHALDAHADVDDVSVHSPSPGIVAITVLSKSNNGRPSEAVIVAVKKRLSSDDIRPLTDNVIVDPATIIDFDVRAHAVLKPGPDPSIIINEAKHRLQTYINTHFKLGQTIALSRLYGAFSDDNIERVTLSSPKADIELSPHQAAHCIELEIDWEVAT